MNVLAGLSVITAVYLLLIAYRYLLKYLGTGKVKGTKTQFAQLHTLVNNRSASGEVQFLFMLKEPTNVKFTIVDKDENEVKVLLEEHREPGDYPVYFDTTAIPNGIYFYRLQTDLQKISKVFKIIN